MDTIFALASAPGKAGVSVVRISGPSVDIICETLTLRDLPEFRKTSLREVYNSDGSLLDTAVVIRFSKGASFTGELVLEIQCHGSTAVVSKVLARLSEFRDTRLADPGEFTRRALENGRLDLTQVDGLADLIEAETEAQRQQAIRVLSGELGAVVKTWRAELIRLSALVQVSIDFSDEDLPDNLISDLKWGLKKIAQGIRCQLDGFRSAERIRKGFEVAIVGRPNVGKSTLLNVLAGRKAALTSETAGTTRDVIEVQMDLQGVPVTILDTAGIRDTSDAVETLGIEYGTARANSADLRVFLVETRTEDTPLPSQEGDLIRLAKADDITTREGVSGRTGAGVKLLLDDIADELKARSQGASLLIRERHRIAMVDSLEFLENCKDELSFEGQRLEIVAEELRAAVYALDSLVGMIGVEDILDEIFLKFCLGK